MGDERREKKSPSSVQSVVKRFKSIGPKLRRLKVKELYLVGSCAQGATVRKSSIDVLVEFSDRVDLFLLSDLKQLLEKSLGRKVGIVMKGAFREGFSHDVEQEMIRVA